MKQLKGERERKEQERSKDTSERSRRKSLEKVYKFMGKESTILGVCVLSCLVKKNHKVLTYIEYRAVSGVFQTIDPPPPLHPASVSSLRTKGAHSPGGEGGGGVNISEDARHWIGLLQYNPYTRRTHAPLLYTNIGR
jgi:hypothetical protein